MRQARVLPLAKPAEWGGHGNKVTQITSQSPRLPSAGLENSLWDWRGFLLWLNLQASARSQEEEESKVWGGTG